MMLSKSKNALTTVLLSTFFAAAAAAQGQTSVPSGPLTPGSTITIQYSNPNLANQKVEITIDDAGTNAATVEIQLDANGKGSASWTVPNWAYACFHGPNASMVARTIEVPKPKLAPARGM